MALSNEKYIIIFAHTYTKMFGVCVLSCCGWMGVLSAMHAPMQHSGGGGAYTTPLYCSFKPDGYSFVILQKPLSTAFADF